jgi:hypothetical protein
VLIASWLALVGCSGGQTGDPGVADHTEIMPGAPDYTSLDPTKLPSGPPPGPSGPCDSVPRTGGGPELRPQGLVPLDPARALSLDLASGRVVELSDPAVPQLRARLQLGELISASPLGGGRALLAVRRPDVSFALEGAQAAALGGEDRLMLVDFADARVPVVLADHAIPGDIALATVVERAGTPRVVAVADEIAATCAAPTKRTTLHALAVSDSGALEPEAALDLGDDVSAVAVRSGVLLVLDGLHDSRGGSSPPTASFIALDGEGALERGQQVSAPGPLLQQPQLWIERRDETWTVAAVAAKGARVVRYRVPNGVAAPSVLADCKLPSSGELGGMWLLGERVLVASWINQDGNRLFEVEPADCTILERANLWYAQVPDSSALIELDFSSREALEARVVTSSDAPPLAIARVALDPGAASFAGWSSAPWSNRVIAGGVSFASEDGMLETHLLAVPVQGAGGAPDALALQLLSFSASSIAARAAIASAGLLVASTPASVATLSVGDRPVLTSFAFQGQAALQVADGIELNPEFTRGYALAGEHWARLRRPLGVGRDDDEHAALSEDALLDGSGAPPARLEVIAEGSDPEQAAVLAHVDINPFAQLVRAGDLFVTVANHGGGKPGTTRLALFDFADPLAPAARGTLDTDALWAQDNSGELRGPAIECLDCDPSGGDGPIALTTARALVLRGYRWIAVESEKRGGHSSFAFQIVDLSDPHSPRVGRTLAMPEEDHAYGAFAVGEDVYYRYARPVAGDAERVRFFVQRIGLADPSAPELTAPINVPGELVAVDGQDTLYTVEISRERQRPQVTLHRVQVSKGIARIAASRALGERRADAVALTGDRLLVDLGAGADQSESVTAGTPIAQAAPVRLLALDAQSLELVSEGDVAYGALRLGASERMVGYATWSGALFVDPDATDDLTRRRFVYGSGAPPIAARLHLGAQRALLADPDSGRLFEIAIEPASDEAASSEPPSACELPPADDAGPSACRIAHDLVRCTRPDGATSICLDRCAEDEGFTPDRCEAQCQAGEYAAACGGVGDMAPSNAAPSPACRRAFPPAPGGGLSFYCCPC